MYKLYKFLQFDQTGHLFDFFIFSHGYIDEDERMEKEKAEKALEEGNDGTQVVIKKEKAYESRKPYVNLYLFVQHDCLCR